MIAEGGQWQADWAADQALETIGFVRNGILTEAGDDYYMARVVVGNDDATALVLAKLLKNNIVVNTFCGSLRPHKELHKSGALSLVRRLIRNSDQELAILWLDLMNLARMIAYEPRGLGEDNVRILYNPDDLSSPQEAAEREQFRGHLLHPDTPYTNRRALADMITGARNTIRWYEQHMTAKTLEVLSTDLIGREVSSLRLLSGPVNIDANTQDYFQRFKKEMKSQREVEAEWHVLTKQQARQIHARFFITEGFSRNLPPLNLILAGAVDEILESDMTESDFDKWWELGLDIAAYQPSQ